MRVAKKTYLKFLSITGVSEKSMVQQIISILKMVTHSNVLFSDIYNVDLIVCEISTPYVKHNKSYEL